MLRACELASEQFARDLREVKKLSGQAADHKLNNALLGLRISLFGSFHEDALSHLRTYVNMLDTQLAPESHDDYEKYKKNVISTIEQDLRL